MDYGPGFSIDANRQRCLRAAGVSLCCVFAIGVLGWMFSGTGDWSQRMGFAYGMVLAGVGALVFGLVAWVRWLDWTRGRRGLLGSAE